MTKCVDLSRIARQLERETQAQTEQQHRLTSATKRAEDKAYASSTVYGRKLISTYIGQVSGIMQQRLHLLRRGTAAIDAATVYKYLKDTDTDRLALLTMKVALDTLGKNHSPHLCDLTLPVGRAIETDLRLEFYLDKDPDLYKKVEKRFHPATGTRQKATVLRLRFNEAEIKWETWSNSVAHKIGAWAVNALVEIGWLTIQLQVVGKKKSANVVRYSENFLSLKDRILEQAHDMAFCQWPMVCEPIEWSNDDRGGYLTGSIRGHMPMVRGVNSLDPVKQGDIPILALNNVQRTKYRINPVVLDVANWAFDTHQVIGKFRRENPTEAPPELGEGATEEQIKQRKRLRREIEDYNAQLHQKNWRTSEIMFIANKYAKEDWFTHAWSACYRGRFYPLSTFSVQGTEFDRALHYFYKEGPVNEWWLAFQCATTAGLDKASMADRIQWTRDNTERLLQIAEDPIKNLHLWRDTDEPWSHLAAVCEYVDTCIKCTKTTSGLPCGIDATQSGIQTMAALTLCRDSGAKVNLTPADKPVDGYRMVAERSLQYIDDTSVHQYICRRVAKRPTMVLPYSGTRESARGYIRDALKEKGVDLSVPRRLSLITTAIYDKAIPEIFPGPVDVMQWMKRVAREVLQRQETITWTSPSGFVVQQNLRKSLCTRVKTRIMGEVVKTTIGDKWGGPDVNHHVNALSPNVIHSCDSALVHRTFSGPQWGEDQPFTLIHDCVLARSCDMDELAASIRQTFVDIYSEPVLQRWADEVGVQVPPDLIKHTLDINEVNRSTYFFC